MPRIMFGLLVAAVTAGAFLLPTKNPKIISITPDPAPLGSTLTITGKNFSALNTSVLVRNKLVQSNSYVTLDQSDNEVTTFVLPADIDCKIGAGCPISVKNERGKSQDYPVKITAAIALPP